MRVLFLSDYFSTWNIGGASRVLASQLEVLEHDENYQVVLVSGYPGDQNKETYSFPWIHFIYKGASFLPNLWMTLKMLAKQERFDLLHIHQPLIGLLVHKTMPSNCIRLYHFHSFWEDEKRVHAGTSLPKRMLSYFKGSIERYTLNKMDHFIVLSEFSKLKLLSAIPGANVTVIPGSVKIKGMKEERSVKSTILSLISVRRLEPRMGLDLLIHAVAQLKKEGELVRLSIVGEGREKKFLQNLINQNDLGHEVKLMGRLDQKDLDRDMKQHHGMVIPTKSLEGFGMSVIEAFAAGLPVLATRVGALAEFEKHEGAFYSIQNPEVIDLLEGIRSVKEDWFEIEERTKTCRHVAETYYSHTKMHQNLTELYQKLI